MTDKFEAAAGRILKREVAEGAERVRLLGASIGRVAPEQGGILPTGGIRVTDEMVVRGVEATGLDPRLVRSVLEAVLSTKRT